MAATKTWPEAIEALDPHLHSDMLRATQQTIFRDELPKDLGFLDGGFVDLGFENLGLETERLDSVLRSFGSTGVGVPNTHWRLRFVYPWTVVELGDGDEKETLPLCWRAVVVVWGDEAPTWVGKKVRPDFVAQLDLRIYRDLGDAWERSGLPS
ncbi:MAG TPA: hypothetical protein VFW73_04370 [Lacipirellulaceae bacterium]|nr:hypothetical protein [Lacipirellulaceae bacterium]